MTQLATPTSPAPLTTTARVGWTILILATLYVCYFSHLGTIGFVGPDEPRYAWIARDMAESGDWITPRLYGKPWFEKPVLYYWAAACFFKLSGVQRTPSTAPLAANPSRRFSAETAARLPCAISALLATLALAWLALRLYGPETARWLLLLLPTTVGMIGFSHAASPDMPFSATLTIAMVCAAIILRLVPSSPLGAQHAAPHLGTMSALHDASPAIPPSQSPSAFYLNLIVFGFFLGLAVLAKGPAAIILSGGAVLFWALFTKRWRDAFRLLHPVAILSFCLAALPWYILCARSNPDFFRIFIIEHNFKRYLTPEFQHIQPVWYYLPVLLIAFLPWTTLLIWSAVEGAQNLRRIRRAMHSDGFFICWAGFCVLFFSISKSKLPGYVLPSVPAICLLMSHQLVAGASTHRKSFRLALLSTALFFSAMFALIEVATPHISRVNENFGITAGFIVALMGACNLTLAAYYPLRKESGASRIIAITCVVPLLLAVSLTDTLPSSYFRWDPSGRAISQELQRSKIPTNQLAVRSMSRGQRYSLGFYLRQEIIEWDHKHPSEAYLLSGGKYCTAVIALDLTCREIPFDLGSTGFFLYRIERQITARPAP